MSDYEFSLFCEQLGRYAKKRYRNSPDAECYVVLAAEQLVDEGIDYLPYPELHADRWTRIDEVLDENTIFPPADTDED